METSSVARCVINLALVAALMAVFWGDPGGATVRAQLRPEAEDQVAAATVLLVALVLELEDSVPTREYWRVPLGSGVLVSADGLILTNSHVTELTTLQNDVETEENTQGIDLEIEDAFLVYAVDGVDDDPSPRYSAILAIDRPELDLAVLEIIGNERGLPLRRPVSQDRGPVELSPSATVDPRQLVHIFGYPVFGHEVFGTVGATTVDIVDGRVRSLESGPGLGNIRLIHIDATVSSGSSGGAVVDERGQLVGVITEARGGAVGGSEAVAIPVDRARAVLSEAGWTDPAPSPSPPVVVPPERGETPVATSEATTEAAIGSATTSSATAVDLESYTSPTYGFTLSYDPSVWAVAYGPESDGVYDLFGLQTSFTEVLFGGLPYEGDAHACVTELIQLTAGEPDVVAAEPLVDANGVQVEGGDENDAFAASILTRSEDDEDASARRNQAYYVRCIVLEPGVSMLGIQQWSAAAIYEGAARQREELLTGLVLP
jgi:S1-C subfamily serine protease